MDPDEHAAEGPGEVVEGDFVDDAPFVGDTLPTAGLDEFFAFVEDRAHRLHPALIIPPQALQPAHPAISLPAAVALSAPAAGFALRADDEFGD